MIRKTNGYLEEYRNKIKSGDIIAGQELIQELDNLIADMESDRFIYDTTEADRRMHFMESTLKLTKSPFYGKPFQLLLFQKAFLSAVYGFLMADTGYRRFQRVLYLIGRKNGKLLDMNTILETPDGRKRFEDIHTGDYVFGSFGQPVKVLWESEPQYDETFEVEFEDGEVIVAGASHYWSVTNKKWRSLAKRDISRPNSCKVLNNLDDRLCMKKTTRELYQKGIYRNRADGKGREYHWRVPMITEPIEYNLQDSVWEPYLLGYWLGNGNKAQAAICCHSDDADELISIFGDKISTAHHEKNKPNGYYISFKKTLVNLKRLGVWNNKHIPEEYFTASVEERLELLKGLMDSDGTVSKRGECSIMQKSPELAYGIGRLLSSLGIKWTWKYKEAKIGDKSYGIHNRITFFVDKSHTVFKLKRKTDRLKDCLNDRMLFKSIIDIRPIEPRLMKCIEVDDPYHLYCVGERNTLTHNSELTSAILLTDMCIGGTGRDIVCSSNDDNQADILFQACDTMRQMIDPKNQDTWRNQKGLRCLVNNNKIFKMSDKTRAKEGRNLDSAAVDEVHEMSDNVIVKSIEQSMSVKTEPLLIMLTTDGFVNDGFLDKELTRARQILWGEIEDAQSVHYLPWLYTMDSQSEVWDGNRENRLWMKANPTLGTVKQYEYLEQQVDLAKTSKEERAFVLTKDFNIHQNSAESWLLEEDYAYDAPFDPSILYNAVAVAGVDLAETTDLCSASVFVMADDHHIYSLSKYWIPETKLQPKFSDADGGARYAIWQKDDMVRVDNHNYVDVRLVADWFYELYQKYHIRIYKCGYDVRFSSDFIQSMDYYGFDTEMVYQRPDVMSLPIKMLEADLRNHYIYGLNDMDKWCIGNASIKFDAKGYGLLVKIDNWASKRIDGAVSKAIAYEMYRRYQQDIRTAMSSWHIQE